MVPKHRETSGERQKMELYRISWKNSLVNCCNVGNYSRNSHFAQGLLITSGKQSVLSLSLSLSLSLCHTVFLYFPFFFVTVSQSLFSLSLYDSGCLSMVFCCCCLSTRLFVSLSVRLSLSLSLSPPILLYRCPCLSFSFLLSHPVI